MRYFALIFAMALLVHCLPSKTFAQQKVLILGVDGVRQDALQAAYTPNLDTLLTTAVYSWDALTETPTWSGVGWSGMLTGVWRNKHGVTDNSFNGSNISSYPHFMQRVESFNPALRTVSISHWAPINTFIVNSTPIDVVSAPSTDTLVGVEAVAELTNADPDVIFLHFDDVDHTGHVHGFSQNVPAYMDAIESVDRQVGDVMAALKARPNYQNEDWLIIGCTDHGATNTGHGGTTFGERNIYYFASRQGQAPIQISKTTVLTNSNCLPDTMGLRMNGAGDHATVPPNSLLQFGANGDFTLEIRLKSSGWSGDPSFLGNKDWNSGANAGFVLSCPFGNTSNWKVNVGDGSNRVDINGGIVADNMWHHLAASFDRNGLLKIFRDGVEEGSSPMSAVGNIDNGLALGIGQDGTLNYGSNMNGLIGEVRIWQTVVDSATLAAWQCMPLDSTHPDYANLLGYWRMNEGSGLTLIDSGPLGLNGTYQGSPNDWEPTNVPDTTYDYSNTPRIVDVAATALAHMCIPIDPLWGLDGNIVGANVPSPQIGGTATTCELQHEFYTVNTTSATDVWWSVSNGLILSPPDSTTIEVQWGGNGPAQIVVQQCNVSDTLDVTINICSSIDPGAPLAFAMYPNPASTSVRLVLPKTNWEGGQVRIYDLAGAVLVEELVEAAEIRLDLAGLAAGLYLVEYRSRSGSSIQKLHVE